MGPIIFLLLPALGYASITVNIQAAPTLNQSFATNFGEDSSVIPDKELEAFHITDSFLKKAAGRFSGGTPSDVFVRSPTPWGDLYKTYNWSEVKRDTKVKRSPISSFETREVVLAVRQFTNNGSKNAVYESKIAEDIENNVRKIFIGTNMAVDVKYNVSLIVKDHPTMHIKFESGFNIEETLIKNDKKLEAKDIKVTVKPNQVVKVFVNATLVTLGVWVNYESRLSGHVAVNYETKYKGHHFWAYDVKELMEAGGVPLVKLGTDIIIVKYYSNAKVTAIDSQSGSTILSEDAEYADYLTADFTV